MTLQEQVCTLEQAQRLKELRCKYRSYFTWFFGTKNDTPEIRINQFLNGRISSPFEVYAYTVAELGEMLVSIDFDLISLVHYSAANVAWLMYANHSTTTPTPFPTEAQARAALLIHILEKEKEP